MGGMGVEKGQGGRTKGEEGGLMGEGPMIMGKEKGQGGREGSRWKDQGRGD